MTIPNLLTFLRFFLAPVFLILYLGSGKGGFLEEVLPLSLAYLLCLIVVVLCEASDLLDGFLARRWGQVSNLGKILDPYADSTFHLTCYFAFTTQAHGEWFPVWVPLLLFYREILVGILRKLGTEKGVFIAARASGKIKTLTQASVVIAMLGYAFGKSLQSDPTPWDFDLSVPLMWIAIGVTFWSVVDYTWHNRHLFRAEPADSP
ncbi:MAG: CDP-diacylglycerol--glycerol-3-phosphate 3-phosphatidyltransferase [Planctomycetota bacterium]|jgi:CDP-diacylglycerol--glycerol-3-phosphate 3-phosphatidyltransferase